MALPQDGQDANGLTKVTQIPAGKELMFIDPTTNEGGIITLEDLTKQILNGLASQAFALDAGQMTLLAALNKLNSEKVYAYTPSFSWSDGTVNPTVENMTAYVTLYGKVCFIYARYNITNLGSFNSNSYLRISLPNGISSIVSSTCLVSPYQITGAVSKLGTRITGDYVLIVDEVGGNYSAKSIPKGYQGFSVFFIIK